MSDYLPRYRTLFGVLLFLLLQPLQAAPLGLTPAFPDFSVTGLEYTYDANCDVAFLGDCIAGQGKLTIDGFVGGYTEVGPGGSLVAQTVINSAFSLTAILDIAGETVVSGSFTLDGQVIEDFSPPPPPVVIYDGTAHPSGNLLNGDLDRLGFVGNSAPSTGGLLEFTFINAGGYIADPLFPLVELGAIEFTVGGMILSVTETTGLGAGNFGALALTDDWTGTGFGDVFVPVPAAVWLFGSGLVALLGLGRGRRNR